MFFAEDVIGPIGWVAVATTAIGGLSTAIIAYMNARHKVRQEHATTAVEQWKEYADRLDSALAEANKEAVRARVADITCREDLAEMRASLLILYGAHQSLYSVAESLRELAISDGHKVPSLQPMPPFPKIRTNRPAQEEANFTQKARQHDSDSIKATKPPETKP